MQIVTGIIMIVVGLLALFFGDREIPVRGSIILKLFRARLGDEEKDFSNWPYKFLFGGALIVAGVHRPAAL